MSEKSSYLQALLVNPPKDPRLVEAALIFYHAGVPLGDARTYLRTLVVKLKEKTNEQ